MILPEAREHKSSYAQGAAPAARFRGLGPGPRPSICALAFSRTARRRMMIWRQGANFADPAYEPPGGGRDPDLTHRSSFLLQVRSVRFTPSF